MIKVMKPGLFTTLQDRGRWGYQAYGMPVAGVMDRYASRMANLLAGNAADAAVVEMTLLGAVFQFTQEAWVSICGADMEATLNDQPVNNWSGFFVAAGSELAFRYAVSGCRSYLAVQGGFDVPVVMGSRSTYTRAGIGGLCGRSFKAGDILKVLQTSAGEVSKTKKLASAFIPRYESALRLRVLLGPQEELFTPEGIAALFDNGYVISSDADRMGYRLEGPKIQHAGNPDIVSDALAEGAIQVPGHGMPIVMMADRQTTGGYAKIGTVIGPDLMRLAQAKPGDTVRFVRCSEEEALAALRQEQEQYEQAAAWVAKPAVGSTAARRFVVKIDGQIYNVAIEEEK